MARVAAMDTLRRRSQYQPLWKAARRRLERNGIQLTGGPLVLRGLAADETDAIAGLLGMPRPSPGSPVRVSLRTLDQSLRLSAVGAGLIEVLQALGGPLRDRNQEQVATEARRAEIWAALKEHPAVAGDPRLADWLDDLRRTGLARRLAGDREAETVQTALRALDEVAFGKPERHHLLPVLAAKVTGDAHGLDRRRPTGTLTAHALAWLAGHRFPEDAADWRRIWAEAGVACDDLSCDVLVVGLPGWAAEPLRLTLRQVTRWSAPALPAGRQVFACENPAVVAAAADALDARCPPLVCVDGVPSTAALMVLSKLVEARATVHYHGDFDWRGIAIAGIVDRKLPLTHPWRFGAPDYERALTNSPVDMPLTGRPQPSPWDPALSQAMSRAGVAIYEEQVLDTLLDDLEAASVERDC